MGGFQGSRQKLLSALLFTGVLALAMALRAYGPFWELPSEKRPYTYHPDEMPIIGSALRVDPAAFEFNPKFYNYGTLQIYLLSIPVSLGRSGDDFNYAQAVMLGRFLTLTFALGTVAVCWVAGLKMAGVKGALAASAFVAVAPLHVQQSMFCTVDIPAVFWVALALFLAVDGKTGWSGLAAGLAAATKYTAGLVIVVPFLTALLPDWGGVGVHREAMGERCKKTGMVVFLAIAGFLIGCPGALLWPNDFLGGLLYEINHARTGHDLLFVGTGNGMVYHLLHSLAPGLGWPLTVACLINLIMAIKTKKGYDIPFAVFVVIFFVFISLSPVRFARYTLPLYPALALYFACFVGRFNIIYITLKYLALVMSLLQTVAMNNILKIPDSRNAALDYIYKVARPGSSIALPGVPWFYSPPMDPGFGLLFSKERKRAAEGVGRYRILIPETSWDPGVLISKPDYVIITNYESENMHRLLRTGRQDYAVYAKKYSRYMELVRRDYFMEIKIYDDKYYPVRYFGVYPLPHDMNYMWPQICIYRRNGL